MPRAASAGSSVRRWRSDPPIPAILWTCMTITRSRLERVRHRRDVRLVEQVAGEVRGDVKALQATHAARRRRSEQLSGAPRVVRPKPLSGGGREDLHDFAVALGGVEPAQLEEPR